MRLFVCCLVPVPVPLIHPPTPFVTNTPLPFPFLFSPSPLLRPFSQPIHPSFLSTYHEYPSQPRTPTIHPSHLNKRVQSNHYIKARKELKKATKPQITKNPRAPSMNMTLSCVYCRSLQYVQKVASARKNLGQRRWQNSKQEQRATHEKGMTILQKRSKLYARSLSASTTIFRNASQYVYFCHSTLSEYRSFAV